MLFGVLGGALAFGLVAGGLVGWFQREPDQAGPQPGPAASVTETPSSSPTPAPPPGTPTPGNTPSGSTPSSSPTKTKKQREADAYAELKRIATQDKSSVDLDNQWVVQLSSKYVGVRDPLQRTASGSHTFKAVDILAEHKALRTEFGGSGRVVLLRGQDWGGGETHQPGGETFWYTFVPDDFASRTDAKDWCVQAFPNKSGTQLENSCYVRRLKPRG